MPQAYAQSCVPSSLPGPPLIESELNNLEGAVMIGPDGLVRERRGPRLLRNWPDADRVEVAGVEVELSDLIENGVVWCARDVIAYPTSDESIRMLKVGASTSRDFRVPLGQSAFLHASDGSFWYRPKAAEPVGDAIEWYRLDIATGQSGVLLPADVVLMDAHEEYVLVAERERSQAGGRIVRVLTR